MKKTLLTLLNLSYCLILFSQYNCKTIHNQDGKTITCLHKNGKPSTIEYWDTENRNGSLTGFSSDGKELFKYYLRNYAGHAYAQIEYHSNGQVSKAYYSSAPDGGIQFFKETRKYDENGNLIDHWEQKYPFELVTTIDTIRYKKVTQKQEVIKCAVPYQTYFKLINSTKSWIEVKFNPIPNLWVSLKEISVKIKPWEDLMIDSVILAERFLELNQTYQLTIQGKKGVIKNKKILITEPVTTNQKRTFTWYIIDSRLKK